jgi:thiol-disulfide isomerase/thioredoxin
LSLGTKRPAIHYFRFAAAIIILILLVLMFVGEPAPPLPAGSQAPEAKVTSYDQREWVLSDYYGRPILVNFWASWCGPCRYEIPHLVGINREYAGRLQVVGLAIDSPAKAVAKMVNDFGINYPIAQVDDATVEKWRAFAVPATYLLNESGQIVWSSKGAVTRSKLQEVVRQFLFSTK